MARKARCHPTDAVHVGVTVGLREPKPAREVRAHDIAVEMLDGQIETLELLPHEPRDRRLAGSREPGEPNRESAGVDQDHAFAPTRSSCCVAHALRRAAT